LFTCQANNTKSATTSGKTLEIKASIIPNFRKFKDDKSKIEGKITITNKTPLPQYFGNEFLTLKVNGKFVARTYKDTIASEVIDFAAVEIKPHSSLALPVYWVFNVPVGTKVESVQLFLDEERHVHLPAIVNTDRGREQINR